MAHARRRQSFLLDPTFQLKWTGYLVAVVVAVMTVLGVVIAKTADRASDSASVAVAQAEKAFEESRSNSILARRTVQLAAGDNPALSSIMEESLAELDGQSAKNLDDVRKTHARVLRDRGYVRVLLVVAGLLLVLLLGVMGVVITHRIVGPVFKIKRLIRQVSTGRLVIEDRLRRGDELEDLFETFLQMTHSLRAMQEARLATLDATIARAEASGAAPDVQAGLRALRAQMLLSLGPIATRSSRP